MPFLRRLIAGTLRELDDSHRVAVEREYCRLLRRAVGAGWHQAKCEYLPRERDRGRPIIEIMADLAIFEELNDLARRQGVDPVEMQRRADLYRRVFRPISVVAAGLLVAALASLGLSLTMVLGLGTTSLWLSLQTTKALMSLE